MSKTAIFMTDKEYTRVAKLLIKDGSEESIKLYFHLEAMRNEPFPNDEVDIVYAVTRMTRTSFGTFEDGYTILGFERDLDRVLLLMFNDFYAAVEKQKKFAKTADEINIIKQDLNSFSSGIDFISRKLQEIFIKKCSNVEHHIMLRIGQNETILYQVRSIDIAR